MSSSPRVTTVVFDFGGVIITTITKTIGIIAEGLGCPATQLHPILMGPQHESGDHPWHRMERGEIARDDLQDLVAPLAAAEGITFVGNEFKLLLQDNQFDVNEYVLEHIATLRDRGYKTGLLTNGMREFHPRLRLSPREKNVGREANQRMHPQSLPAASRRSEWKCCLPLPPCQLEVECSFSMASSRPQRDGIDWFGRC